MNPIRLLCVLAALSAPGLAAARAPEPRTVDAAVATAMKSWSVPGVSVVVVLDGKVVHLKGYGVRESNKDGPVTPDTLFCLGSCSKAFTTAALASLVEDGKLGWDDRVRDHLPTFRLSDALVEREVRIRDLLCHRTGITGGDLLWYRSPWGPEEAVARLRHLPLSQPFRTTFRYNNVTFTAAGLAAARANGTSWADLIQDRLLSPLGMKRTVLDATTADKDADRAGHHRPDRAGDPEPFAGSHMRKPDPAGSIHSSARELATWLNFHLDEGKANGKQIVAARALRETHTPQIVLHHNEVESRLFPGTTQSSYAMAWVVLDHDENKMFAHGGALDGHRAQILLVPGKKLGIAVLSNLQQTSMNVALSFALLDLYLGSAKKRDYHALHHAAQKRRAENAEKARRERFAVRRPDTTPSLELNTYAGTYHHPAYGTVSIRLARGRLVWEYRGEKIALGHFHHDTFRVEGELPGESELTFILDDRGGVRSFEITGNINATFPRGDR